MNRKPETELQWEYLNGLDEWELVEEIKFLKGEGQREPLVQEVIRATREHIAVNHLPAHTSEVRRTIDDLLRACGALAGWKPT